MKKPFGRERRLTIIYGILCIVLMIIMLQLWLLIATMNAYLGGDHSVIVPAALASLVCLGLNAGLLWYIFRMERQR
jgi:multidrug resistance efflux pump